MARFGSDGLHRAGLAPPVKFGVVEQFIMGLARGKTSGRGGKEDERSIRALCSPTTYQAFPSSAPPLF